MSSQRNWRRSATLHRQADCARARVRSRERSILERQIEERRPLLQAAAQRLRGIQGAKRVAAAGGRAADGARLQELRGLLDERRRALAGASAAVSVLQATTFRSESGPRPTRQGSRSRVRRSNPITGEVHGKSPCTSRRAGGTPGAGGAARAGAIREPDRELADGRRSYTADGAVAACQGAGTVAAGGGRSARTAVADAQVAAAAQTDVQIDLARLESDLATEKEIDDKLDKRYEMARVSGDLGSFEGRRARQDHRAPGRADRCRSAAGRVSPSRHRRRALLGLGLAITAELSDDAVRRRPQVEGITGLPVLARIARFEVDHVAETPDFVGSCVRSRRIGGRTGAACLRRYLPHQDEVVMRPPPVLVQVVQELTPGGIQVMVLELERRLRVDFDVHVVSLEGTTAGLRAAWPRVATIGDRLHALGKAPGVGPGTAVRLTRLLRRLRALAVHTHHIGPLLHGGLAARLAGVRRLVHTEHDAWHLDAPNHRRLQRAALAAFRPRAGRRCTGRGGGAAARDPVEPAADYRQRHRRRAIYAGRQGHGAPEFGPAAGASAAWARPAAWRPSRRTIC